ncbi:MAG: hypothetical protein Q8S84_08685 [bacterium]|nr:hypothetical protein [bacterium]MDP3381504.1 hypothetical protein [bacterium]
MFGNILLFVLIALISLIISSTSLLSLSILLFLSIETYHQSALIKSHSNHNFWYISSVTNGIYGCHSLSNLFITYVITLSQYLETSLVNLNSSI